MSITSHLCRHRLIMTMLLLLISSLFIITTMSIPIPTLQPQQPLLIPTQSDPTDIITISFTPYTPIDLYKDIEAVIDITCVDDATCRKDKIPALVKLTTPCDFAVEIDTIELAYTIYSSISDTDGQQGGVMLQREQAPEPAPELVNTNDDVNVYINNIEKITSEINMIKRIENENNHIKNAQKIEQKIEQKKTSFEHNTVINGPDDGDDDVDPPPTPRLIFSHNELPFGPNSDLKKNQHIQIKLKFPNLISTLSQQCPNTTLTSLQLTVELLSTQSTTTFPISIQPLGNIHNDTGFNSHSHLAASITKIDDATTNIYAFSINAFIDDIQSSYLYSTLVSDHAEVYLVPTGTLQYTLEQSGYQINECQLLNTKITAKQITKSQDLWTKINYYTLSLPIQSDKYPITDQSPYFDGSLITDQMQLRCDFILTTPFTPFSPSTSSNAYSDHVAPFVRSNDWGFTVVLRQPLCPKELGLFNNLCSIILPFNSVNDRQGKDIGFVDLTNSDIDISNQVNLNKFFDQSTTRFYNSIPTTIVRPIIQGDKQNTTKIPTLHSYISFTIPLPTTMLTTTNFLTPNQLQLTLHINSHGDQIYQTASYYVHCIDQSISEVPELYLHGDFFSIENQDRYDITHHSPSQNHTSTHVSIDQWTEKLIKTIPDNVDGKLTCELNVLITMQDNTLQPTHRTYPLQTLILTTSQQFASKTTLDLLRPVMTIFEAPVPHYDEFATPYANVATMKIAVATTQTKGSPQNQYNLDFQLTNIDSYYLLDSFKLDIFGANWTFTFPTNNQLECTVDIETEKDLITIHPTATSNTMINFEGFKIPALEMASFKCTGLGFAQLSTNTPEIDAKNAENVTDLSYFQPIIAATTKRHRYYGYLLGEDAVAAVLNPKTKKLVTLIVQISLAAVAGIIFLALFICCCCCKKSKNNLDKEEQRGQQQQQQQYQQQYDHQQSLLSVDDYQNDVAIA